MRVPIVGGLCISVMGHDKGEIYVISRIESVDFVWLSNGTNRTLSKAKKKRVKHIRLENKFMDEVSVAKLLKGELKDGEIHRFIKAHKA